MFAGGLLSFGPSFVVLFFFLASFVDFLSVGRVNDDSLVVDEIVV